MAADFVQLLEATELNSSVLVAVVVDDAAAVEKTITLIFCVARFLKELATCSNFFCSTLEHNEWNLIWKRNLPMVVAGADDAAAAAIVVAMAGSMECVIHHLKSALPYLSQIYLTTMNNCYFYYFVVSATQTIAMNYLNEMHAVLYFGKKRQKQRK